MMKKLDTRCYKNNSGNWVSQTYAECGCGVRRWMDTKGFKKTQMCKECRALEYKSESAVWSRHPMFHIWWGMVQRCSNPANSSYSRYGAVGRTLCAEWANGRAGFERFLADMGERPEGTSLDRIDNTKGYSRENCRWGTVEQQSNNRMDNVVVSLDGATLTIAQWARKLGVPEGKIRAPIRKYSLAPEFVLETIAKDPKKRARWKHRETKSPKEPKRNPLWWKIPGRLKSISD